jgi:UDPglucose 6-dehydrogenase
VFIPTFFLNHSFDNLVFGMDHKHILMVGTGYVGLVTGTCFAEMGHSVICLDIDKKKIDDLNKGIIPIYEPGLSELVKKNVAQKRLQFTTDYPSAVASSLICYIGVPTPSREDGSCNISYVETAARQIAAHMDGYRIIVNKSTVPVGTTNLITSIIQQELDKKGLVCPFDVLFSPEFLKEGSAVQDCLKPDRIIIGSNQPKPAEALKEIYSPFAIDPDKILMMDILSAEMTKYAANAMLATRISFMNEIADVCKKVGANVNEVRKGIGTDTRIGHSFLYPGPGYGGSCFPKDVRALIATAEKVGTEPLILKAVNQVNIRQKQILAEKMSHYFQGRGGIKGKTITIWGLAFKPNTDDMREAPSLNLIEYLLKEGAKLRLFDPIAMTNAKKILGDHPALTWCKDEFDAATGAHAIALLTEWKQFKGIDFGPIREKMVGVAIFDGRNQYQPLDMKSKGFDYISIGVPDHLQENSQL